MTEAEARAEAIDKLSGAITKIMTDSGRLVELGFRMFILLSYTTGVPKETIPLDMPKNQYDDLRSAFFAGAQHLFGTMMNVLDPGGQPTDDDMRRMELINSELDAFIDDFAKRHGIKRPVRGARQ